MKLNLSTIWALAIVSSAAFARPLYNSILSFFPRQLVIYVVGFLIFISLAFILRRAYRSLSLTEGKAQNLLPIVCAVIILVGLFLVLELPEEKIHIVLYSILGFVRATERNDSKIENVLLFVLTVSISSEVFQAILPDRFCDIRDVLIDTVSGFAGGVLAKSAYKRV